VRDADGLRAAVKGAPETVLAMTTLSGEEQTEWLAQVAELSGSGHKVIACAARALPGAEWPGGEPDHGYRFAGLLAFEDPVGPGVAESVANCREAGIQVVMVTGDHPDTARAIARELGLGGSTPNIITGDELESRLEREGNAFLKGIHVVARAVPAQKLRLVRAFEARGETVAVTGDGVNDVPALQAADIGIAMGGRGTRSAREVASIVLLDDNFRTIVRAIAEGRQLFRNLRRSFAYLLMIHIPLVISAALIPLAGYPLLYLPVHVVWLELLIHPTALLVFQGLPADTAIGRRRRHGTRFFDGREWATIGLVGASITLAVAGSYERSLGPTLNVEHARAMALAVLTLGSAGTTAALTALRGRAALAMIGITVALSLLLIQTPPLAEALHLHPLHANDWGLAAGLALVASLPTAWVWRRGRG
jgi:Ca2+-transporting ATPase